MSQHLTAVERDRIAQLRGSGASQAEIAARLGRHASTISRELKRNATAEGEYLAAQAQQKAVLRRRHRPRLGKTERGAVDRTVRHLLARHCSPDQIAARMKLERPDRPSDCVSASTIYRWIRRSPHRRHWESFLRRRGRRPRKPRKKCVEQDKTRIAGRPAAIERREQLGHFEADTVLGQRGTGGLATFVCRRSRYTILFKIQHKRAEYLARKTRQRLRRLDPARRRSLTPDNGGEFARFEQLGRGLAMKIYWADPGRPFQRGTNENTNGLTRSFFPKGLDFRNVNHHDARLVENLLNNRPRKCLGYRTPREVFYGTSDKLCCD